MHTPEPVKPGRPFRPRRPQRPIYERSAQRPTAAPRWQAGLTPVSRRSRNPRGLRDSPGSTGATRFPSDDPGSGEPLQFGVVEPDLAVHLAIVFREVGREGALTCFGVG